MPPVTQTQKTSFFRVCFQFPNLFQSQFRKLGSPEHTVLSGQGKWFIYFFNTRSDGVLTPNGSIQTSLTNPLFLLSNGKYVVANGGNIFKSYLRNPDGSLTFKNDYTSTNIPVFMQGSSAFHSSGKFFYYTVNTATAVTSFSKLQMDESGSFFGEVVTTQGGQNWYVLGPIHPIQNYFMTFHQASTVTRIFYPISDLNTGALGTSTNNNSILQATLYPENGNCVFSLNANFMYCANMSSLGNNGTIVQMSVTSTTNTVIGTSILVQSVDPNQSPKSVVLHPNGNYIYAYGNTNIYAYSVDQTTGIINPAPISVTPTPGGASCPNNTNISRLPSIQREICCMPFVLPTRRRTNWVRTQLVARANSRAQASFPFRITRIG